MPTPNFEDIYEDRQTATLAAGTVSVADTATTANSIIEVGVLTGGGTQGAIYLGAKTAGTGFAVKSTSGTDTSVVWYKIVQY